MKLIYGPNSPYSRKCRIVIAEKNIQGVEMIPVSAIENPPELLAISPLCTVPAFATDEGMHLCGSQVICEYLDSLPSSAPKLLSDDAGARICILALATMADGMMDAAVATVMEGRRPQEKQWDKWVERKTNAVARSIDKIAGANLNFDLPLSMGMLATVVALQYVDFRLPQLDWRAKHPALAAGVDKIGKRPSFAATMPQP